MRPLRHLAAAASLVLVASLSACGGGEGGISGSGAPDNASTDDFCEAYNGLFKALMSSGADESTAIKALKQWASDMEEVGTPEDIPEDARRGFELLVETASNIDDDATLEDLSNLDKDFDEDDQKYGEAFTTWATETCPTDLSDMGLPTDLPTELPTDLLTDMPTDLPTDPSELESMLSELTSSP